MRGNVACLLIEFPCPRDLMLTSHPLAGCRRSFQIHLRSVYNLLRARVAENVLHLARVLVQQPTYLQAAVVHQPPADLSPALCAEDLPHTTHHDGLDWAILDQYIPRVDGEANGERGGGTETQSSGWKTPSVATMPAAKRDFLLSRARTAPESTNSDLRVMTMMRCDEGDEV